MTKDLDVLLIENRAGIGIDAARALEADGHRVHRCYDDPHDGFPCRGLAAPSACPVDGPIDVALVVRSGYAPAPSHLEQGVSCAVRANVPIVEQGPAEPDPFRPWVAARVPTDGDVAGACAKAAAGAFDAVRIEVQGRIARLLGTHGIESAQVPIRFEPDRGGLDVHLDLPVPVPRGVEQALAVRVLDGIRGVGRTFGRVDVHVHAD